MHQNAGLLVHLGPWYLFSIHDILDICYFLAYYWWPVHVSESQELCPSMNLTLRFVIYPAFNYHCTVFSVWCRIVSRCRECARLTDTRHIPAIVLIQMWRPRVFLIKPNWGPVTAGRSTLGPGRRFPTKHCVHCVGAKPGLPVQKLKTVKASDFPPPRMLVVLSVFAEVHLMSNLLSNNDLLHSWYSAAKYKHGLFSVCGKN